jgi:hypothetical protein
MNMDCNTVSRSPGPMIAVSVTPQLLSMSAGSQGSSGATPVLPQLAPVTASRTRASGSRARTWPLTFTGVM